MIEVIGNLWTYPADARVITTNGIVKSNGECVMGRGCAKEARDKAPGIAKTLGTAITVGGNNVHCLGSWPHIYGPVFSFPVKHHWKDRADLGLIKQSASQLVLQIDDLNIRFIVLPRPGCGNGNLRWEDVKPIINPILDDRFHVITF